MLRRPPALLAAAAVAALSPGCGEDALQQARSEVRLANDEAIVFGDLYLGAVASRSLELENRGGGHAEVTLVLGTAGQAERSPSDLGFSITSGRLALPPASRRQLEVTFSPQLVGVARAVLRVSQGTNSWEVALRGGGLAWPDCSAAHGCEEARFDPQAGECLRSARPDGSQCDPGSSCIEGARCQGGACLGVARRCDDGSVCTVDYCVEGEGCRHDDRSSACRGLEECHAYWCDPKKGCQSEPVPDGSPCGTNHSCQTAEACYGGRCQGIPVPDDPPIPCKLWWAPCVSDANCKGGECRSPTAEAERPGDIRWSAMSRHFIPDHASGWRAAATVDELGNAYLDDDPADNGTVPAESEMVALGSCGQEHWRIPHPASGNWTNGRHLIEREQLISVTIDQSLESIYIGDLSQRVPTLPTPNVLWKRDLRPLLPTPADASCAPPGPFAISDYRLQDLALSNAGRMYLAGDYRYGPEASSECNTYHRFLASVRTNGTVEWLHVLPALTYLGGQRFGYPLVVDAGDNLYVAWNDGRGTSEILSFEGLASKVALAFRFAVPIPSYTQFHYAFGGGFFLEPASFTAWNLDGTLRPFQDPSLTGTFPASGHSPVADAAGNVFIARRRDRTADGTPIPGRGELAAFTAAGAPLWPPVDLGEGIIPVSSIVLGTNDTIYMATAPSIGAGEAPYPGDIRCFDTRTGAELWSRPVPGQGRVYNGVLALTDTATLLLSTREQIVGFFAGPNKMPPAAHWPRFRGDNHSRAATHRE
jgi:outer membrane protein assembly factor BamB